jgi:hypothetical protein
MWRCSNCETQIDDDHTFCWQCGKRRVHQEPRTEQRRASAVPGFASFEQLAPEPPSHGWLFKRGLSARLISYALLLVIFVIFKILASRFFGTYGLYIFVGVALVALILILWRVFHRDPSEGVGIKLH